MLLGKPVESLTKEDIQNLIDTGVEEGEQLDFKRDFYQEKDPKKKLSFLKDVTAFANQHGGYIICGITDGKESRKEILGISNGDYERQCNNLNMWITHGVTPNLTVRFHKVAVDTDTSIVIIDVPRSFNAPHQISESNECYFYIRKNAGNQPMTVDELRFAFNRNEVLIERARAFRDKRVELLSEVASEELPYSLANGARVCFHILPLYQSDHIPLRNLVNSDWYKVHTPNIISNPNSPTYLDRFNNDDANFNLDGLSLSINSNANGVRQYIQIFHHGQIEVVKIESSSSIGGESLGLLALENILLGHLSHILAIYSYLRVTSPFVVAISLLNIKGWKLAGGNSFEIMQKPVQQRKWLKIPEIVLYEIPNVNQLRDSILPLLDLLWNAGHYPGVPKR